MWNVVEYFIELVNKLCSFLCNMLKSWEHVIEVVNKLCSYQRTPLFSAASSGNVDAVRHLVDKDADVNIKDDYGGHNAVVCVVRTIQS